MNEENQGNNHSTTETGDTQQTHETKKPAHGRVNRALRALVATVVLAGGLPSDSTETKSVASQGHAEVVVTVDESLQIPTAINPKFAVEDQSVAEIRKAAQRVVGSNPRLFRGRNPVVTVRGGSSPEDSAALSDVGLTEPSAKNEAGAQERADIAADEIVKAAKKLYGVDIQVKAEGHEYIALQAELEIAQNLAKQHNMTLLELIRTYDNLPEGDFTRGVMEGIIGSHRTLDVSASAKVIDSKPVTLHHDVTERNTHVPPEQDALKPDDPSFVVESRIVHTQHGSFAVFSDGKIEQVTQTNKVLPRHTITGRPITELPEEREYADSKDNLLVTKLPAHPSTKIYGKEFKIPKAEEDTNTIAPSPSPISSTEEVKKQEQLV